MRLIDADALLKKLKKTDRYFMLKADIDNAPTVEVTDYDTGYQDGLEDGLNDIRPKGEWNSTGKCSVCGEFSEDNGNFCPNCGADMRGSAE